LCFDGLIVHGKKSGRSGKAEPEMNYRFWRRNVLRLYKTRYCGCHFRSALFLTVNHQPPGIFTDDFTVLTGKNPPCT